jgi:hypothetical protein
MLGSALLDCAIGLIFIYLLLSIVCTTITEGVSAIFRIRAQCLEKGLRELLKEKSNKTAANPSPANETATDQTVKKADTNSFTETLFRHPLLNCLFQGEYQPESSRKWYSCLKFWKISFPSYIPSRNFALALMDTVFPEKIEEKSEPSKNSSESVDPVSAEKNEDDHKNNESSSQIPTESLQAKIDDIPNQIQNQSNQPLDQGTYFKKALQSSFDATNADLAKVREEVEKWFDSSMDRIAGWYKKRVQLIVFIIATILVLLVNVDSIAIINCLSQNKEVRDQMVAFAIDYAKEEEAAAQAAQVQQNPAIPKPGDAPKTSEASKSPETPVTEGAKDTTNAKNSPPDNSQKGNIASQKPSEDPAYEKLKKAQDALAKASVVGLPIGWNNIDPRTDWPTSFSGWLQKLCGWLLTALAISLGAPFWFDVLSKFISIRSSLKPDDKKPDDKKPDEKKPEKDPKLLADNA